MYAVFILHALSKTTKMPKVNASLGDNLYSLTWLTSETCFTTPTGIHELKWKEKTLLLLLLCYYVHHISQVGEHTFFSRQTFDKRNLGPSHPGACAALELWGSLSTFWHSLTLIILERTGQAFRCPNIQFTAARDFSKVQEAPCVCRYRDAMQWKTMRSIHAILE